MEKSLSCEEQQAKIIEVRKMVGSTADQIPGYFTDAAILRYLRTRNWDTKKASKMVVETVKWRLEYQPEKIRLNDVAHQVEIGSMYLANYLDKYGRSILVIRPGPTVRLYTSFPFSNYATKLEKTWELDLFVKTSHETDCLNYFSVKSSIPVTAQVRFFVYGMENAIMNLAPGQHQVVWLIGYQRWKASGISFAAIRKTIHLLQLLKPFVEARTYRQMKFVYSNDPESQKTMEIFNKDKLERSFGGNNPAEFNFKEYSERMKEDDRKMLDFVKSGYSFIPRQLSDLSLQHSEHEVSASCQSSEASHKDSSSTDEGLPNLIVVTK
ncbi:hypothetical protein Sjap_012124 [Stephania japonica]|uniref:CRAL/TRIO N-terminal domain-containing protein n=1 Tax=Stephania japonica TaxID=461633 RepID=A0AAP0IXC8_9MAGN